jgi:hypothetical protein
MAYNIAKYNVYSISSKDKANIRSDYEREPVYPILLAAVLKISVDLEKVDLACLLRGEPVCSQYLWRFLWLNVAIVLLIGISAYYATWTLCRSRWASALAMAMASLTPSVMGDIWVVNTELPAALWLTLHSIFLSKAIGGEYRLLNAGLAGGFLGLLILTKTIFLGWLVIIAFVALIIVATKPKQKAKTVRVVVSLLLPASLMAMPWLALKYNYDSISSKDGAFYDAVQPSRIRAVLGIRAAFSAMTWQEYRAAFVYYTPHIGPELTESVYGKNVAHRFNRKYERSIWREAGNWPDPVKTLTQNWGMNIVLVPLFAYRAAFVGGCCTTAGNIVPKYPVHHLVPFVGPISGILHSFFVVVTLFYFPIFLTSFVVASAKRNWRIVLFLAPAMFSYLTYSALTHNLPRYSQPLVPILVVVMVLAIVKATRLVGPPLRRQVGNLSNSLGWRWD